MVKKDSYEIPAIFNLIAKTGNIAEEMMYNTFNMGIGMIVAVDADKAEKAVKCLEDAGEKLILSVNLLTAKRCGDSQRQRRCYKMKK